MLTPGVLPTFLSYDRNSISIHPRNLADKSPMKLSHLFALGAVLISSGAQSAPDRVHFDAGKLTVRAQDVPVIAAQCQYAAEHSELSLQLLGHTDLRGSKEFSIAIGYARAERVRAMLASCGVATQRMETLSYGKECPLVPDASATAGRTNRRVDIIYIPQQQPLAARCADIKQ